MDAMAGISRTTTGVADRLRSDVPLTGFEAAPSGAAAVLPRYYLGYLNSLEHPWKTMERLVGTSARRGIPVWHWSAGKPRPQK